MAADTRPDVLVRADVAGLQHALLEWGDRTRRDFPWRRTRDPWAILVSESMLQQTQASRVVDPYRRFLARFPTATDLAEAPVAAVIDAWAGLGYNRRAVALHRAAEEIRSRHGGEVPRGLDDLLALTGVGPYTARAVSVFAFERDLGVVDTNVTRLFVRWRGEALSPRDLQSAADVLVPAGEAWRWTQALFDLGATTCRARSPRCADCPARAWCRWQGEGPDPDRRSRSEGTFAGSDRQGRGRLVAALRNGPVARDDVASTMGWPDDDPRAWRVAGTVVRDGLAVLDSSTNRLMLPPAGTGSS